MGGPVERGRKIIDQILFRKVIQDLGGDRLGDAEIRFFSFDPDHVGERRELEGPVDGGLETAIEAIIALPGPRRLCIPSDQIPTLVLTPIRTSVCAYHFSRKEPRLSVALLPSPLTGIRNIYARALGVLQMLVRRLQFMIFRADGAPFVSFERGQVRPWS